MGSTPSQEFFEVCSDNKSTLEEKIKKLREVINSTKDKPISAKEALLEADKDPDLRNALHLCCGDDKKVELLKILLDEAKFNIENPQGIAQDYPLHIAVRHFALQNVRALLERGCNVAAKNEWKQTALMLACKDSSLTHVENPKPSLQLEIIRELLSSSQSIINEIDYKGEAAIHKAVQARPEAAALIVAELIASGANLHLNVALPEENPYSKSTTEIPPSGVSNRASSALHRAVVAGNDEVIKLLLAGGVDKNEVDPRVQVSPLFLSMLWTRDVRNKYHRPNSGRPPVPESPWAFDELYTPLFQKMFEKDNVTKTVQQHLQQETIHDDTRRLMRRIQLLDNTFNVLLSHGSWPVVPRIYADQVRSLFHYAVTKKNFTQAANIFNTLISKHYTGGGDEKSKLLRNLLLPSLYLETTSPSNSSVKAISSGRHIHLVKVKTDPSSYYTPEDQSAASTASEASRSIMRNRHAVIPIATQSIHPHYLSGHRELHVAKEKVFYTPNGNFICVCNDSAIKFIHAKTGLFCDTAPPLLFSKIGNSRETVARDFVMCNTSSTLYVITRDVSLIKINLVTSSQESEIDQKLVEETSVSGHHPVVRDIQTIKLKDICILPASTVQPVGLAISSDDRYLAVALYHRTAVIVFDLMNSVKQHQQGTAPIFEPKELRQIQLPLEPSCVTFEANASSNFDHHLLFFCGNRVMYRVNILSSPPVVTALTHAKEKHRDNVSILESAPSASGDGALVFSGSLYETIGNIWKIPGNLSPSTKPQDILQHRREYQNLDDKSGNHVVCHDAKFCPVPEYSYLVAVVGNLYNLGNRSFVSIVDTRVGDAQANSTTKDQVPCNAIVAEFVYDEDEIKSGSSTKELGETAPMVSGSRSLINYDIAKDVRFKREIKHSFSSVSWSPDGKTLAVVSNDGFVHYFALVYNLMESHKVTGNLLRDVKLDRENVFSPLFVERGILRKVEDDDESDIMKSIFPNFVEEADSQFNKDIPSNIVSVKFVNGGEEGKEEEEVELMDCCGRRRRMNVAFK